MRRQTLVRLCLALFMLAATLGMVGMTDQNAVAAPCCSSCDARYEACLAGTAHPACGGDPACCDQKVFNCYSNCSFSC
jgi:hypothetical protein